MGEINQIPLLTEQKYISKNQKNLLAAQEISELFFLDYQFLP